MMSIDSFVSSLIAISPRLLQVEIASKAQWRPDEPPATILFGDFGDFIVSNVCCIDDPELHSIFNVIEMGMCSRNSDLMTAVGTGLIEAMVNSAEKTPGLLARVVALLGPKSRLYAEAWLKF